MAGLQNRFHQLKRNIDRFIKDEHGATSVEYAMIATGMSIAIISVVFAIGETLNDDYFTPAADGINGS